MGYRLVKIDGLEGVDMTCLYLKGSQPYDVPAVLQVVDGCPQDALHPHLQQLLPAQDPARVPCYDKHVHYCPAYILYWTAALLNGG